jgi:hypothetical protein
MQQERKEQQKEQQKPQDEERPMAQPQERGRQPDEEENDNTVGKVPEGEDEQDKEKRNQA